MQTMNILFTSAGRRVELVQLFRKALAALGVEGKLVTADLKPDAPAHFAGDAMELLPRVNAPEYVDVLKQLCQRHNIGLLVPLIDTELHVLAPHREAFAALGTRLLVSAPEVAAICLDKRRTHDFFCSKGIPTPALLDAQALLAAADTAYPLLLKPAQGSSSKGVTRIGNARELAFFAEYIPDAIVQPLMLGDEYTLDILCDFQGKVLSVVPRLRIETRAGEISKGLTVAHPLIIREATRVAEALPGAIGPVTVQCFLLPDGTLSFIEINPRFGGGFPLSAAAGADFPRWVMEMCLGRTPSVAPWRPGTRMTRYDQAFYSCDA